MDNWRPIAPDYCSVRLPSIPACPIPPWRRPSLNGNPFLQQQFLLSQHSCGPDPFAHPQNNPSDDVPQWRALLYSKIRLIQAIFATLSKLLLSILAFVWRYLVVIPVKVVWQLFEGLDWWVVGAVLVAVLLSPLTAKGKAVDTEMVTASGEELRYELVGNVRRWAVSSCLGASM